MDQPSTLHKKMNPYGNADARVARDKQDRMYFEQLKALCSEANFELRDIVTHFSAIVRRRDISRLLAHYELFKRIRDVPGSIAELGVYRGAGLMMWHHFLELFCPSDRNRRVYGFDHFKGYEEAKIHEPSLSPWIEGVLGSMASDEQFIRKLIHLQNSDNFLGGVERSHLISGDIGETLPQFVDDNPGLRLSLLYFDIGTYDATFCGLKHLFPLLVTGGIAVFNGYGMKPWEGETTAVNDYFSTIGGPPAMKKFEFSTLPHGWFEKKAHHHV